MTRKGEIAVRLLIDGRVQGVGYRQWMAGAARGLGLRGFVRNLSDGRVEAIVAGPENKVEELAQRAGRGPRAARVAHVAQEPAAMPTGSGFEIKATASG